MALTATLTKKVGLAPGLKAFVGTITAGAGESGSLVVATSQPLFCQYWDKTSGGDFTPVSVTQSYSTSTTTGYTTFTITTVDAITDGKFTILGL